MIMGTDTVLVIDDEPFVWSALRRLMGSFGVFDILVAEDGNQGLAFIEQWPDAIKLAFCDLKMPGMDGVVLIRHLAECGFKGAIILISGEDEGVLKTVERLGLEHNLNILGALSKPITKSALARLFEKLETADAKPGQQYIETPSLIDLRRAIEADEIVPYYQPKVSLVTRRVIGVEALARWLHPERGLIPPAAFIPLAEQSGLINPLTYRLFEKAVNDGGSWVRRGLNVKVSVNASLISLAQLEFAGMVSSAVRRSGMDIRNLIVEVTESRLMDDVKGALETLSRLRLKGVGLSIDDFGTGHSSMEQLKKIPFTELKIDQSFVQGAIHDVSALAILQSSVDLARRLSLTTVAEGLEEQEDWDMLENLGVDLAQGYFVAKPMPADEFVDWVWRWNVEHLRVAV